MTVLLLAIHEGWGQDKVRKYASRQYDFSVRLLGLGGSIENEGRAVNGQPHNASTLKFTVGALGLYAEQVLDFNPNPSADNANNSPTFSAGTPITLKISLPSSLLGLGNTVIIQPINNLRRTNYSNVGNSISESSLLSLLNGDGEAEITIVPNVDFQGIRIRLTSILDVGASMSLFHAYILEDAILPCDEKDKAIDILSGVRAGAVDLANATGTVNNPWNAIDGNPNTYTEINTGAQVLSEVYHTTIFQTASRSNQVTQMILQNPDGGLLDLGLLNDFTIQPYLRTVPVGQPLKASNLLSLRLLPGSSNKYELIIPIEGSFDRIEIKMGGVADVLNRLRIYEINRLPELPIINEIEEVDICKGETVLLTASAPDGSTLKWYTQPEGGTVLWEGENYLTPPLDTSATYYVSTRPIECLIESPRLPIRVNTLHKPGSPQLTLSNNEN